MPAFIYNDAVSAVSLKHPGSRKEDCFLPLGDVAESCSEHEQFCTVGCWTLLQGKGTKGDGTSNYFAPNFFRLVEETPQRIQWPLTPTLKW